MLDGVIHESLAERRSAAPSVPADSAFVEEWKPYVGAIVRRVTALFDLRCQTDDLMAFGLGGLLEAHRRFDPTRGVKFSTFAYYRVRGAVLDGVRKMAYLPPTLHTQRRALVASELRIARDAGRRSATKEEAAARLDRVLGDVAASFVLAAIGQDEERSPSTPEDVLIAVADARLVRDAVEVLPRRERALVEGVYFRGRRFDDIAGDLGISKSWASRLHARAITMLRRDLASRAELRDRLSPARTARPRKARGCSDRSG